MRDDDVAVAHVAQALDDLQLFECGPGIGIHR